MSRIKPSLFGPLLASLFLGGFAMAGTTAKQPPAGYVYQNVVVGHHIERRLVPINANPGSYILAVETGRSTAGAGDYWAYKTVGRRQVRVWVHDVSVSADGRPYNGLCGNCSHRYVSAGHQSQWKDFCMIDGRSVDCGKNPAECPECAKMAAQRMEPCHEEVQP